MTPGGAMGGGMTRPPIAIYPASLVPIPDSRLVLLALVLATLGLGLLHSGMARPVFVLGCAWVGYLAWREGPARSVQVAIGLFSMAPFLRRIVDLGAGFDQSGIMLLGPVLAILVPVVELRDVLMRRSRHDSDYAPLLVVGCCILYGGLLSAFQGEALDGGVGVVKGLAPLLYGAWIMRRARGDDSVVQAAAQAFMVVTPPMGLYAMLQYANPPEWDRYWMVYAGMNSIGQPLPFLVRCFSTMNSPASYATFSACGLLLFGYCRRGWLPALLALPVSIGLALSLYRTAWIALAVGMLYCACFLRTRQRSILLVLAVVAAGLVAANTTEFGDKLVQRVASFGQASEDGSGRERVEQLVAIYNDADNLLIGGGLASLRLPRAGLLAVDGEVVAALLAMGVIVGPVFLLALAWTGLQALARVRGRDGPTAIVCGAVVLGALAQMPLASITSGELGFLFFLFVGLATARRAGGAA